MNEKKSQSISLLKTLEFSQYEKELILKAKNILHIDKPALYHDCIMASVMQIIRHDTADRAKKYTTSRKCCSHSQAVDSVKRVEAPHLGQS